MSDRPRPLPVLLDIFMRELGHDRGQLSAAMRGLARYQQAPRDPSNWPAPSHQSGRAMLQCIAGGDGPPLILVPSIINGPEIMALDGEMGFAQWLGRQGFRVHLLDWGGVTSAHRDEDMADHVTRFLVPLIQQMDRPPHLIGYCLGGTLAMAAATMTKVRSLTLIAAPWDFSAMPEQRRADVAALWVQHRDGCRALGLVPMEILQSGFWALDPARVARKYVLLGGGDISTEKLHQFVRVEDWANHGAPMPLAAARTVFERFYHDNATALGQWTVDGHVITPDALSCPVLNIRSTADQLVPAAAAPQIGQIVDNHAGHVGMMIGSTRHSALWQPVANWLKEH